jgi:hypothetical protein
MREPKLGAKLFLGGYAVQKTGTEIATALNNMDVSSEYALKLRHRLKSNVQRLVPEFDPCFLLCPFFLSVSVHALLLLEKENTCWPPIKTLRFASFSVLK